MRLPGLTFGYIQALAPTITSELFGLAHFATNTAFVSTMFIVTSFAMANGMSSWIYRAHIRPPHRHCLGPGCFRLSFLVCTVVGVAAGLASLMLTTRRVKYYRRMTKCALHLCCANPSLQTHFRWSFVARLSHSRVMRGYSPRQRGAHGRRWRWRAGRCSGSERSVAPMRSSTSSARSCAA